MRLGLFGGSFDPPHYGHLLLAEYCREACQLDEVWFVPAAQPPHKRQRLTPPAERIEMLELATVGHEPFRVSRVEIDRGGVSYTVDTLEAVRAELAAGQSPSSLVLLVGGDSYRDLPTWRDPERICELAELAVVERADAPPAVSPVGLPPHRVTHVAMPRIDLASREIRRRVAQGASIRYQTPRAVEEYIRAKGLYRE